MENEIMQQKSEQELISVEMVKPKEDPENAPKVASTIQNLEILRKKGDLLEEVLSRENMLRALKQTQRNKGAPGIDKMSGDDLSGTLKREWPRIKEEIMEGRFQPSPVRLVEIPKSKGGMRKLGVPTVLDRLIQQAL